MSRRSLDVRGRKVDVLEAGEGDPLVYLHGFADVHGVAADFQPFHQTTRAKPPRSSHRRIQDVRGAMNCRMAAASTTSSFHYLEVLDALGLQRFDLVGHCAGGWIAAELAVRHPETIARLVLIGACGLFVPGEPIGDVFMHAQPERGTDYQTLRTLLFSAADAPAALRFFPDGRGDIDEEMRRYQMLRFGSFVGFKPPYFYSRALRGRLHRAAMPALVVWGDDDRMVPRASWRGLCRRLCRAPARLELVKHCRPRRTPAAAAGDCRSDPAVPALKQHAVTNAKAFKKN